MRRYGHAQASSPDRRRRAGRGPAQAANPRGEAELERALAGRVAGEPVRCISLHNSSSSTIIDDTAILYRVGSTIYVNRPRAGAESLDRSDTMVNRLWGSQLVQHRHGADDRSDHGLLPRHRVPGRVRALSAGQQPELAGQAGRPTVRPSASKRRRIAPAAALPSAKAGSPRTIRPSSVSRTTPSK